MTCFVCQQPASPGCKFLMGVLLLCGTFLIYKFVEWTF